MSKVIKVALCTVRNEEKTIYGWLKMLSVFADRIVILFDPETNDNTERVIADFKKEYPNIQIDFEYQDRMLGDSDNKIAGKTHNTIMHVNKTKWVNEHINENDWFIDMGCDERFSPSDIEELIKEVEFAKTHGLDAVLHRTMYEPIPANITQLCSKNSQIFVDTEMPYNGVNEIGYNYSIDWQGIHHIRFQRKGKKWIQNANPHSSFQGQGLNPLYSNVPLWHFHRIKYNSQVATSWRDEKGSIGRLIKNYRGKLPVLPVLCDFDWIKYRLIANQSITEIASFGQWQNDMEIAKKNCELYHDIEIYRKEFAEEANKFVPYFQLPIPKKQLNMLLIGTNTLHSPTTQTYYKLFQQMGFNVTWVGVGAKDLDLSNIPQKMMYFNGLQGQYSVVFREMKLHSLLNLFSDIHFDCIVHLQDQIYFTEEKPINMPYVYVLGQSYSPRVPKSASIVLCSTKNAMKQLKYYYGKEFPIAYLPPFLREDFLNLPINNNRRTVLTSFSGEMYEPDVYNERRKIITGVEQHFNNESYNDDTISTIWHWLGKRDAQGLRHPEKGLGRLSWEEYKDLLLNTRFGLSCPTESGMCFRDLEVPASGSILVTKRTPDLEFLGFRHGINCYFYSTVNDVIDIIMKEWNPQIAEAGYTLANKQTPMSRANEIKIIIEKMLD
jgi:hypothetical protein